MAHRCERRGLSIPNREAKAVSQWTKSAQPVLEAGAAGACDALAAQGSSAVKVGAQYLVWHDGRVPKLVSQGYLQRVSHTGTETASKCEATGNDEVG
jgi:hypothetical protein